MHRAPPAVVARAFACALALVLVLLSVEVHAAEVPVGRYEVVHLGRRVRGLEVSIPRGGAYERAILAVRARRYRQAHELFSAAEGELWHAGAVGRIDRRRARALVAKSSIQSLHALKLWTLERDARQVTDARLVEAVALHNLYLTSSAYFGRDDRVLLERARQAYEAAISIASRGGAGRAVLGFAGLLAASGDRRGAQRLFATVELAEPTPDLLDFLVHYHAAMGDGDRAFEVLARARDANPAWPELRAILRVTNDLDSLRSDPRFPLLLGEEE